MLAALESSIKARKFCGNEARERPKMSTNYCSNILKIITFGFIAVIAGTELHMVNYVQQQKGCIKSLSNFTLESRNSGYALVYEDKVNLKKPTLRSFTQFGFGMGPKFSSDAAGDGPRKRLNSEDEYDPKLERLRKKKATRKKVNLKRKRSKAERQADNLKQNPKRTKAERQADNLKQHPKRTKAERQADNVKQHPKRTKAER